MPPLLMAVSFISSARAVPFGPTVSMVPESIYILISSRPSVSLTSLTAPLLILMSLHAADRWVDPVVNLSVYGRLQEMASILLQVIRVL